MIRLSCLFAWLDFSATHEATLCNSTKCFAERYLCHMIISPQDSLMKVHCKMKLAQKANELIR